MAARGAHWVLVLALTGVLHQVCLCQELDEVVVQSEGTEAQLLAAGAVLLDGPGLLDTTADAQLTSPATLVEPTAAAATVCVTTSTYCSEMCPKGGCVTNLTASMTAQGAAVGGGVRGRVRGKPDRPGADDPPPLGTPPPPPPVVCDVGSATSTNMKYIPDDKRFKPIDFYHSCLGNAAVGCDDKANTVDPDPTKIKSVSSCCSCYLYSAFFDPKHSSKYTKFQTSGKSFYKDAAKLDPANNLWHLLVMPADPCPGVEHYNNPNSKVPSIKCPGEDIWKAAQAVIDSSNLNDAYLWGMAINPVNRRGQHQMHVHVAQVYNSLLGAVVYGYHTKRQTSFELSCTSNRLEFCDFASTSAPKNVKVTVKVGTATSKLTTPDLAEPFKTAYPKLDNTDPNGPVLKSSTLVLPMPFVRSGGWAIIRNPVGPAECFFNPNGNADLIKACS